MNAQASYLGCYLYIKFEGKKQAKKTKGRIERKEKGWNLIKKILIYLYIRIYFSFF